MRYEVLPDGRLKILAGNTDRSGLTDAYALGGYPQAESFIAEGLHERLAFIPPENIGALTEAPILTDDAAYPDDGGGPVPHGADAAVWWFPDYMIRDPWAELKNKGRVVLTRAA